ncbi:MAG: DUF5682 family protein [Chloroflexota bacterium]
MLIVPVRHHSPAAALQVGRLIRERRPRVVLIEGPSDATPLIDQLLDAATVPPVALYAYVRRGDDVRAAFYPFCAYSPEYEALRAGREVGAELRFCDLPATATLAWEEGSPTPQPPPHCDGEGEPDGIDREDVVGAEAGEGKDEGEAGIGYRSYTEALAEAAGFDTFEGFWEAAFEQQAGSGTPDGYVEVMTAFGEQARELLAGPRDEQDDRRERAMAAAARACLDAGIADDEIVLVCGAAHARRIAAAYGEASPLPNPSPLRGRGAQTACSPSPSQGGGVGEGAARADMAQIALIPYSYPRLSEQAGYGAGNRAPWYYQQVWQLGGDYGAATRRALVVAARQLREKGYAASPAQAIDGFTLAVMLAGMREKQAPGVDELVDAAVACFGQGHGDAVAAAMQQVLIGDAVGRITGKAGRTPLQEEYHATVERLRLPALDTPKQVLVHLAGNPVEAEQSVFLHRLGALGVPYGTELASGLGGRLAQGPLEQLGQVRERWELQWTPATDARLIERTAWGSTLAEACGRVLREKLDKAERVDGGTEVLLQMTLCDLAESAAFGPALARCEALAADSGSFPALARATYHLDGLLGYGAARKLPAERLLDLAGRLFARAVLHLPTSAVCGDEAADEIRTTLLSLYELVQRRGPVVGEREDTFWRAVETIAERPATHPGLRGLALVLLELAGRLASGELTRRLRYWLSLADEAMDNARLVAGLFALHRATLVRNRALIGAVTDFLLDLDLDRLTALLPVLRRSLGSLSGPERTYLSETLATVLGVGGRQVGRALAASSADREWLHEADREITMTLESWRERYGIGA